MAERDASLTTWETRIRGALRAGLRVAEWSNTTRYWYWSMPAERYLTGRLFGAMVGWIAGWPVATGKTRTMGGEVFVESAEKAGLSGSGCSRHGDPCTLRGEDGSRWNGCGSQDWGMAVWLILHGTGRSKTEAPGVKGPDAPSAMSV